MKSKSVDRECLDLEKSELMTTRINIIRSNFSSLEWLTNRQPAFHSLIGRHNMNIRNIIMFVRSTRPESYLIYERVDFSFFLSRLI